MPIDTLLLDNGKPNPNAMLQCTALEVTYQWQDATNTQNILNEIGGGSILAFTPSSTTWPPGYCILESGNQIIVVIEGTVNFPQWVSHSLGVFAPLFYAPLNANVNPVWLAAYLDIKAAMKTVIDANITGKKLIVIGHSYGCATATYLSCEYAETLGVANVSLVCIASPRVMGLFGPTSAPDIWIRLENQGDLVCDVPPKVFALATSTIVPNPFVSSPEMWSHRGARWTAYPDGTLTNSFLSGLAESLNQTAAISVAFTHPIKYYLQNIYRYWQLNGSGTSNQNIANICIAELQLPDILAFSDINDPQQYTTPAQIINAYNLPQNTPINNGNIGGLQLNNVEVIPVISTGLGNIGVSNGNMASIFKTTFIHTDGRDGWSSSYACSAADLNTALGKSIQLLPCLVGLLGFQSIAVKNLPGKGTPGIEFIRVSDYYQPKNSLLYPVPDGQQCNGNSTNVKWQLVNNPNLSYPSENAWTTAFMRLQCGPAGTPASLDYKNIELSGMPDIVLNQYGVQLGNAVGWQDSFLRLVNFLRDSNHGFGMFGHDPANPAYKIVSSAYVAPFWNIVVQGVSPWIPQDRIRLERTKSTPFQKLFVVANVTQNSPVAGQSTIQIVSTIPTTTAPITQGNAIRQYQYNTVGAYAGLVTPCKIFFPCPLNSNQYGLSGASKRNRGRPFLSLAVRGRAKTRPA
jgi:pimeloyl-ACP methyl ester carboxylesterase